MTPVRGPDSAARPAGKTDAQDVGSRPTSDAQADSSSVPPAPRVLGTPAPGGALSAVAMPTRRPAAAARRSATATVGAGGPPAAGGQDFPASDGVRIVAPADLRCACELLREDVAQLTLPLEVAGVDEARRELNSLLTQLDDYLLPRLRRIDAPLLAVVGGSTGAGKSTLVNSLVRRFVTRSGVLRPTTRSPVLIHHPYDSGAFLTQRILPGFARVTSEAPEPHQPIDVDAPRVTALRLVPDDGLAPGLAIIDAPDIDSLVETNRDLAIQLLAAADLWIFVTTAVRYSDAVPWDMLRTAVDRGVSVAVVLDRVPAEAMNEVRVHLAQKLRDRGLSTAPLFTIPETAKDVDGFLPKEVVAPLHGWLSRLARDSRSRDVVVRRTLVGALDSLHERVRVIVAASEQQFEARQALSATVDATFDTAARRLRTGLGDGSLLRGEVEARWQEFVGSGDAFRGPEGALGRLRDRFSFAARSRPPRSAPLIEALRTGVHAAAVTVLRTAVEQAAAGWRAHPAGPAVLRKVETLATESAPGRVALADGAEERLARAVQDWQTGVLDQVRADGQSRWTSPRAASPGVDGTAIALMLLALGGDGVPPGPVVEVARRVLGVVLGDKRDALADAVRADLERNLGDFLAAERARFIQALAAAGVRDDGADVLRQHLRAIEKAR
jgi:hypothetical protein